MTQIKSAAKHEQVSVKEEIRHFGDKAVCLLSTKTQSTEKLRKVSLVNVQAMLTYEVMLRRKSLCPSFPCVLAAITTKGGAFFGYF